MSSIIFIGWIGPVCLLIAGVGLTFGATFDMDPVTADPAIGGLDPSRGDCG